MITAQDLYCGELLPADVYEDWTLEHRESARARARSLLGVVFAVPAELSAPSAWLLDVALRVDPLDDQRLLDVARRALRENHMACAKSALERALAIAAEPVGAEFGRGILTRGKRSP